MTKEKKKLNHDEKLRKKFFRNLRFFCKQNAYGVSEQNAAENAIIELEKNERFNPVLNFKFKPVCACELSGFDGKFCSRHNRIWNKNARLLYSLPDCHVHGYGFAEEAKELWLLEDMTLVVAHCTFYTYEGEEEFSYCYKIDGNYSEVAYDFDVEQFLSELGCDIEEATNCFED